MVHTRHATAWPGGRTPALPQPLSVSTPSCRALSALCRTTLPVCPTPPAERPKLSAQDNPASIHHPSSCRGLSSLQDNHIHHNQAAAQLQGALVATAAAGRTLQHAVVTPLVPKPTSLSPHSLHTLCHLSLQGLWPPRPPRHAVGLAVLQTRPAQPLHTHRGHLLRHPCSIPGTANTLASNTQAPSFAATTLAAGLCLCLHLPPTTPKTGTSAHRQHMSCHHTCQPPPASTACASVPEPHSFSATSHRRPSRHTPQSPKASAALSPMVCLWPTW